LLKQATHCPSGAHSFAGKAPQSVLLTHCTHEEWLVSQTGVGSEQFALPEHPERQTNSRGSQMGRTAPQSELFVHCAQVPVATRHRGASAGQSLSPTHSTHCAVARLQTFVRGLPQSEFFSHPTQTPTPDDVSHIRASAGQTLFEVQAAWQLPSLGQQAGIAAGQSLFLAHAAHAPVPGTHIGTDCGQFALDVHSTHPSEGSHWVPELHSLVPLTPQSALPGPGPAGPSLLPPHATRTATIKAPAVRLPRCPLRMLASSKELACGPSAQGPATLQRRWTAPLHDDARLALAGPDLRPRDRQHRRGDSQARACRVPVGFDGEQFDFLARLSHDEIDDVACLQLQALSLDGRQENEPGFAREDVFDDK